MNQTVFAIFGLGFLLGLRHALEPDHVVAVSTITASEPLRRPTCRSSSVRN